LGVFEDANLLNGDQAGFREMITDLQSRGLDSVMFANNFSERDRALFEVSDELGFNVYPSPNGDLAVTWWPSKVPANLDYALESARPIVERWSVHPSVKGYITRDEPSLSESRKVGVINNAFRRLDGSRPVMPILIGVNRVGPIFQESNPSVMLIDVYPAGAKNPPCDLTMTGFGYHTYDFVSYIRAMTENKPPSTPLWVILQTHSFLDQLREPTVSEVREQHWLAIGEGAKGIFWFVYSSQQGWKGLADNPPLYTEVTSLVKRTLPIREVLLGLQKVEDVFSVTEGHYVSTLRSSDERVYAVAVNKDCLNPRVLRIDSLHFEGQLRDLETSVVYKLGAPISFLPGDGKIFELAPEG
jgi:hypothetical protein